MPSANDWDQLEAIGELWKPLLRSLTRRRQLNGRRLIELRAEAGIFTKSKPPEPVKCPLPTSASLG